MSRLTPALSPDCAAFTPPQAFRKSLQACYVHVLGVRKGSFHAAQAARTSGPSPAAETGRFPHLVGKLTCDRYSPLP
jgi:hypothetical protein